jgi:hypothetical protein
MKERTTMSDERVWRQVMSRVIDRVLNQIRCPCWIQVFYRVEDQVFNPVENPVRDQARNRGVYAQAAEDNDER